MPIDYNQLIADVIDRKKKESSDEHQLFYLQKLKETFIWILRTDRYRYAELDEFNNALTVWMLEDFFSKESIELECELLDWYHKKGYDPEELEAIGERTFVIAALLYNLDGFYQKEFPAMRLEERQVDVVKDLVASGLREIQGSILKLKQNLENGENSDLVKCYVFTREERLRPSILKTGVLNQSCTGGASKPKKSVTFHPDTKERYEPKKPHRVVGERPCGGYSVTEIGVRLRTHIQYDPNPGVEQVRSIKDCHEVSRWTERNPLVKIS
jgi:hypothetical protein